MSDSAFLTRVELHNYKSIAHCDVELGPLMFLVGPNGAGKSNFLDALRFVSDALSNSLEYAVRQRKGIYMIPYEARGQIAYFYISLDFQLPSGATGTYSFRIEREALFSYKVTNEECRIRLSVNAKEEAYFQVENGQVTTSEGIAPVAVSRRLYLVAASSIPAFRLVYDALSRMSFYNLSPEAIRESREVDTGEQLTHNGSNITSVLINMSENLPDIKRRIEEYLVSVVPSLESIEADVLGSQERLIFTQQLRETKPPLRLPASSMSDGTLRALGILVALFQKGENENSPIPLVGIEEPETALHPAAVEALLDAMSEVSETKQILVTSHSADLLDSKEITAAMLLAVVAEDGVTKIGPLDRAGQYALREHLYTAGELQRINQLRPDLSAETEAETGDAALPAGSAA